tara:strand:+ start:28 stop:282 length:255 start_codon:yes stop_codon:yes gene_type:complete
MAQNITVSNNYIVLDDEGTNGLEVFPKTSIYQESSDEFLIRVDSRSKIKSIAFSQVGTWFTAADGLTAFTEATLRVFLQTNTGL